MTNIHSTIPAFDKTGVLVLTAQSHLTTEGFIDDVSDFIKMKLKTVRLFTPNLLAAFKSSDNTLKALRGNKKALLKLEEKIDYLAIMEVDVAGVVGLNTDLVTITNVLKPLSATTAKEAYKRLDKIDTMISRLITEEAYRTSFMNTSNEYAVVQEWNKEISKAFDFINKGTMSDSYKVKDLVPNLPSIRISFENSIDTLSTFDRKNIYKLRNIIEELEGKFELLYDRLKEEHVVISNEALELVVGLLNESAIYISNISTLYYLNRQIGNTIVNMITKINN